MLRMSVCRGEVDEALVLLIEANTQQAQQAGATQVVEVLTKLSKRIQEEKERKLPEEQVSYSLRCSEIDGLVDAAEISCWCSCSAYCERYSGSTPPKRGRTCCTRLSSRSRREMRKEEFWKVRVRVRVTENLLCDVSITEG